MQTDLVVSEDDVIALATVNLVVPLAAVDSVVMLPPIDIVASRTADYQVVAVAP